MKTRLAPLAVVLVLFTAACGGGSDKTKADKSDSSTSTTASADATSTTAAAGTGATTTVKGGATATTVKSATATTTKATTSTGVPTPAAPGTYDYSQSGTSTLGNPPSAGTLKVDPANASGVQVWHLGIDSNQPTNDTTLVFRSDGPFMTDLVQRAAGMTVSCHFDSPLPAPPWPATDGKPINGHANCGSITADVTGSITGHKTVALEGKSVPVIVAVATITTHGQIESTSTQEQWWAPSLRIPTHTHTVMHGTYAAFAFNSDITTDLKSATPH